MTDFPPAPPPARAPWGLGIGVGGAIFATFALGFTEGCLEIDRRPIPLRFALRFAAANMLPSAVWSSISARHVAAASGVPLSALIGDAGTAGSCSTTVGKRLVLVKSVRALRLVAGSYGLSWSLWRWYEADSVGSNNDEEEGVKYGESVVRLAPVNSPLSPASRRKHAGHIVTVPMATESWKKQGVNSAMDAVDWEKVGVEVQLGEQVERVKVVEVELSDAETTAAYAGHLQAKASRGDNTSLCSVAVLPPCGPPLPTSMTDSFDVCFNPLSAVLTFIASVCHDRGVTHVLLVVDQKEEGESVEVGDAADVNANNSQIRLSASQLATGLLYRHGITTRVVKTQEKELHAVDEHVEGELTADDPADSSNSGIVFFISESLHAGQAAARTMVEQGKCYYHVLQPINLA